MLYRKTNFLVGMTLTVAVLLVTGTASGAATEVSVSGGQTTVCTAVCDPGTSWVDEEGITHVRGQILRLELTGDLTGVIIQRIDFNLDFATGNGDLHGSAEFVGTLVGVPGVLALAGRFDGDISGFLFSAESIGLGTLGGAKAQSRLTTTGFFGSGVATYTGRVLFPQGP